MRWRARFKLRAILSGINLAVLLLPLYGVWALRIYESALIRQTESELIAQGAVIAAAYRATLARLAPEAARDPGYGQPLDSRFATPPPDAGRWRPHPPLLDLARDAVLPSMPAAERADAKPEAHAAQAGAELTSVLRDAQLVTLAGMWIVDPGGIVVASTFYGDRGRALNGRPEVVRALAGEYVSVMRARNQAVPDPGLGSISRGARVRVVVGVPIVIDDRVMGAVILVRTPLNIAQALYGKRYHLLGATLALVVVVLALSTLSSLTIARPMRAVVAQARRAAAGERGAMSPLEQPVTEEVAELSDAVAGMAQTLEQRADYIRSFAANVSHEFKTPLTSIAGTVELLRDHLETMAPAERRQFLDNLSRDAERLSRLVRRLLDLARADVMQGDPAEGTQLPAALERIAHRFRERGLAVELAPVLETSVAMGEDVFDSIVSNLLDNTLQHGGHAVSIEAACEDTDGTARLALVVRDDGPGISPANAVKVFQPFFTTARNRGGTGLGLAVVKSLLAAHRGTIELVDSTVGTAMRIVVPLREHIDPTGRLS